MPIVLLFNQITENVIKHLNKKGYVHADGTLTGTVTFRMSTPPFNVRLGEKSAIVKTFLDAVKASGGAYNMPAYGDAMTELVEHTLARDSVVPYTLAVDDFVVGKAGPAWETIKRWLRITADTAESSPISENALMVLVNGDKHLGDAFSYVRATPAVTLSEWHEFLTNTFGPGWRATSENMNSSKFLKLFGANDELLSQFVVATGLNHRGESVQILNEARWVANFMNLFKPTTEFKKGAVSDMLNFAAMFSKSNFRGKQLTDADSVQALRDFITNNDELSDVEDAFFDMEPDDAGVLTYVWRNYPNAKITRVYPTSKIADAAEKFFATRGSAAGLPELNGEALIDKDLENSKILESIYC